MKDRNTKQLNINLLICITKLFVVLIVFLISHLSSLILPKATAAEQTLRVSPVIINVTLSPGKTYLHEVTVENLTDNPLPLRATLNDFIAGGEEGGYIFEETKDNPLLSWIQLNETEFIINPSEKKTINMTITTPASIPLGGYYGVLFFEPVTQTATPDATRVNSKIGVLMLANVGVPDPNAPKAEIVDFTTPLLDADGDIPLLLRVKNISLNFFTAKPILTLTPLIHIGTGPDPKELTLEDKIIFPDKIRRWTEDTTFQDLTPNIYKVQIAVSTGNGQHITTGSHMIVFPYDKALAAVLILLTILFIIVKRKRLKKALIALYK